MKEPLDYIYKEQIEAIITRGIRSLIIDFDDLLRFDPESARKMLKDPDTVIQSFEEDFAEIVESIDPEYAEKVQQFHLRFQNIP